MKTFTVVLCFQVGVQYFTTANVVQRPKLVLAALQTQGRSLNSR